MLNHIRIADSSLISREKEYLVEFEINGAKFRTLEHEVDYLTQSLQALKVKALAEQKKRYGRIDELNLGGRDDRVTVSGSEPAPHPMIAWLR